MPEIDWLKGFAILCVVCIHAKVYDSTLLFEHVVNRAVPIFLVLFGVTSELWWGRPGQAGSPRGSRLREWYVGRARRLLPPLWAMATAWWLGLLYFGGDGALRVGWMEALATYAGYAPWIGTSWFITIILQLVVLFPGLRWLWLRVGPMVSLPAMAAICVASAWYVWDIVAAGRWLLGDNVIEPGWYYAWIFVPRVFWPVAAGVFVGRWWVGRPPPLIAAASLVLVGLGVYVCIRLRHAPDDLILGPFRRQTVEYLLDVPLTVGMLGVARLLLPLRLVARALTWCGIWSWGIYLGHLLVHEVLHVMLGITPEGGPEVIRVIYAVFLFIVGTGLAVAASAVRRATSGAGRSEGVPPRAA